MHLQLRKRLLILCAAAVIAGAIAASAIANGNWITYCSNTVFGPSASVWDTDWNYYYGNAMYNSDNTISGVSVRVQSHYPNGTWLNTSAARGNLFLHFASVYVQDGCTNTDSVSYYAYCQRCQGGTC